MTSSSITVLCGGPGLTLPMDQSNLVGEPLAVAYDNRRNDYTPCQMYQQALEECKSDVLIYCHDDLTIYDPDWLDRIMEIFLIRDYTVAVGLGGASNLGNWDLYRKQFNIWNMARGGYVSNQTDAEVHGGRFTGIKRVAVLDAFCMAVRRDWLLSRGGWPLDHLTHHCLDLWLACEAARSGKETWMVGASCTHHGGGSSIQPVYAEAKWLQGGSLEQDHSLPHRWLWNEYRDVLPLEVK